METRNQINTAVTIRKWTKEEIESEKQKVRVGILAVMKMGSKITIKFK